jgi:uncharacterized protein YggE
MAEMKNNSNSTNLVIIGLLVVLALNAFHQPQSAAAAQAPLAGADAAAAAAEAPCATGRTGTVSGAAVVYVDRALIQLGVQSNGSTPDATQAANGIEIQRVINSVRALGVEAKDIATDYYIVYPVYSDYNSLVIQGYRIDNTISITVRDIKLADDVIVAALKAGANEVQDVQFYLSNLRQFRDQAREMAMQAASEKAAALANAAGAQAGCVLTINENTWTQYYGSWAGGRQTALWAQNNYTNAGTTGSEGLDSDDSPITLGQIAVRAEVDASFSLQ